MNNFENNKERYRILCDEKELPLFMQAWWLDAVCAPKGKTWNVIFYEEKGKIAGVMLYVLSKKCGFRVVSSPYYTKHSGIWIDYSSDYKQYERFLFEKRVINGLIDQLENLNFAYYSQSFPLDFTNWQPFYWRGFKQTTRYTYLIRDLSNLDNIFKSFSPAKQRHIKKENDNLQVDFSVSAEEFYDFHKKCLQQKNAKIEYSQQFFTSICSESIKRKQGKIIALKDNDKNIHSALFLIWDKNSAYALIYAINPQFKNSGASTKIFWEAIKFVSDKTQVFDFEGSMTENVAQSYQQFGTEQVQYFSIEKYYSKVILLRNLLLN